MPVSLDAIDNWICNFVDIVRICWKMHFLHFIGVVFYSITFMYVDLYTCAVP